MYTSGGFQQNIEGNVFEGNGGPGVVLFGTRATTMDSNCKSETILFKLKLKIATSDLGRDQSC